MNAHHHHTEQGSQARSGRWSLAPPPHCRGDQVGALKLLLITTQGELGQPWHGAAACMWSPCITAHVALVLHASVQAGRDCVQAHTSNLHEELGMVDTILSDKKP